jgi:prepilin-type N-terminal cleavage/methylation domain-containing protein
MKYLHHRRSGQRGMTLVEILVAVAILAVVMVVVLSIYDLSRKSFKKGENITEQQQAVRIAFDQRSTRWLPTCGLQGSITTRTAPRSGPTNSSRRRTIPP